MKALIAFLKGPRVVYIGTLLYSLGLLISVISLTLAILNVGNQQVNRWAYVISTPVFLLLIPYGMTLLRKKTD